MATVCEADLALVREDFLYGVVPKDKQYLKKHFNTEMQLSLVSYYCGFSSLIERRSVRFFVMCFRQHMGIACNINHAYRVVTKIRKLEEMVRKAEEEADLELLARIKLEGKM